VFWSETFEVSRDVKYLVKGWNGRNLLSRDYADVLV
jgi:hypothetical protein